MHSPAFLRKLFQQAHRQKMNCSGHNQQQELEGTSSNAVKDDVQQPAAAADGVPTTSGAGDDKVPIAADRHGANAMSLFLNVAHMVRQSSDTTNNRNRVRQLARSSAFDEFSAKPLSGDVDDEVVRRRRGAGDEEEVPRPATSQCVECNAATNTKMSQRSPYLRRTKLTKKVTRICAESLDHSDGEGYLRLNQYRLIEEIGQGSYGIVKLAYNEQDKNLYAMKVLDKLKLVKNFACFRPPPIRKKTGEQNKNVIDGGLALHRNPLQLVQREIAILKKLSHPNVVKLVEVLDDPSDNYLYMVFEYVERRSLLDLPTENPLSENVVWRYFRDTLKGLEYLHYQKIVHRDLKPSNLLHTETESVKIADFGVSCEFEGIDAFLTGTAGTPAFMAPEALTENSSQFYSGRAQDLWSLGVTLYSLVFGNVPFWDPYVIALHRKIKNETLNFPEHIQISNLLKALISGMLQKDPALRLMLHEIKMNSWVTRNGKVAMPSEEENCTLVTVTEEEIRNCVRVIPRLDTLILVKAMGRKKHFGNPFRNSEQNIQNIGVANRRKSSSVRGTHYTPPESPLSSSARPDSSRKDSYLLDKARMNEQLSSLTLNSQCNGALLQMEKN